VAKPPSELARALRAGEREKAVFLLARLENVPRSLRDPLHEAAVAALLCETYDAAPAGSPSFQTYRERREQAKAALVDQAEQTILKRRPRKTVEP
jgi:hypothetical protein